MPYDVTGIINLPIRCSDAVQSFLRPALWPQLEDKMPFLPIASQTLEGIPHGSTVSHSKVYGSKEQNCTFAHAQQLSELCGNSTGLCQPGMQQLPKSSPLSQAVADSQQAHQTPPRPYRQVAEVPKRLFCASSILDQLMSVSAEASTSRAFTPSKACTSIYSAAAESALLDSAVEESAPSHQLHVVGMSSTSRLHSGAASAYEHLQATMSSQHFGNSIDSRHNSTTSSAAQVGADVLQKSDSKGMFDMLKTVPPNTALVSPLTVQYPHIQTHPAGSKTANGSDQVSLTMSRAPLCTSFVQCMQYRSGGCLCFLDLCADSAGHKIFHRIHCADMLAVPTLSAICGSYPSQLQILCESK